MLPERKKPGDDKLSRLIRKDMFLLEELGEVAFRPGEKSPYTAIKHTVKKAHSVYLAQIKFDELPILEDLSEPDEAELGDTIEQTRDPAKIQQELKDSLQELTSGNLSKEEAERLLRSHELGTWMIRIDPQENKVMATVKTSDDIFRHEFIPYCEANPVGYLWLRFGGKANFFKA